MVNTAPERSVRLVATMLPCIASTKPRQIARPKPRAGTPPISAAHAVELVEDVLQIGGRNARPLVQHLHDHMAAVLPRLDGDQRHLPVRTCRIVQQIEQHLLEQHLVQIEHRQIGLQHHLRAMLRQDLAGAPQRAADHIGQFDRAGAQAQRPRFQPRHVQQVADETIEPLRLVLDVVDQVEPRRRIQSPR